MTFFKTAVVAAALVTIGVSANAATWTFGFDANSFRSQETFEGTFDQVYGNAASPFFGGNTNGGVTVNASAWADQDKQVGADPFMDAKSGGLLGGLGVCSSGDSAFNVAPYGSVSKCSSGSQFPGNLTGDDNLMFPELLKLTFSQGVRLTDLVVRDGKHNLITSEAAVVIDGIIYGALNGVVQGLDGAGFKSMFEFTSVNLCLKEAVTLIDNGPPCNAGEVYLDVLSAQVPIPAAGFLLLGGLGGLVVMRRRRS
ncbi:MAG: VPLPA-CTERM sorting domain-containing protein [Boseongicola sp.]